MRGYQEINSLFLWTIHTCNQLADTKICSSVRQRCGILTGSIRVRAWGWCKKNMWSSMLIMLIAYHCDWPLESTWVIQDKRLFWFLPSIESHGQNTSEHRFADVCRLCNRRFQIGVCIAHRCTIVTRGWIEWKKNTARSLGSIVLRVLHELINDEWQQKYQTPKSTFSKQNNASTLCLDIEISELTKHLMLYDMFVTRDLIARQERASEPHTQKSAIHAPYICWTTQAYQAN